MHVNVNELYTFSTSSCLHFRTFVHSAAGACDDVMFECTVLFAVSKFKKSLMTLLAQDEGCQAMFNEIY